MSQSWPDQLQHPDPARVAALLAQFWHELDALPDLIQREEHFLCAQQTSTLRGIVAELMLALNGIAWPAGTRHLNSYLGASQRAALERTLAAPSVDSGAWIGQAVALTVIFRWYAPQLVTALHVDYPQALEDATLDRLQRTLDSWPQSITTA